MKSIIATISALFMFVVVTNAQIDIKANPLGLIFNQPDIALEFVVAEKIGLEVSNAFIYGNVPLSGLILGRELRLKQSGYKFRLSGRYYFIPKKRGTSLYMGAYCGPKKSVITGDIEEYGYDPGYEISAFSVGLLGGYKHILKNGLIIDLQFGLGYGIGTELTRNDEILNTSEIPLLGLEGVRAVSIGYRFDLNKVD